MRVSAPGAASSTYLSPPRSLLDRAQIDGGMTQLDPRATQRPPERLWPRVGAEGDRVQTIVTRVVVVAVAVAVAVFVGVTFDLRLGLLLAPWSADGDQPQAVWHYWRYHIDGAIPPGDLLTDYAFVMHAPPVWWALMAGLSTFFEPVDSAKILNVIAYIITPIMAWIVVARRSIHLVGAAAAFLVVRSLDFNIITAGGYARSFGPFLTLLFLHCFFERRHYACLFVLVLQAAFYPSVVIPCGIAYGLYVVVAGPGAARKKRVIGMFVAGVLILLLGKSQDLSAPKWWGPMVSEAEALEMPSWKPGGRINEAPLRPMSHEIPKNLTRAFTRSGQPWSTAAANAFVRHRDLLMGSFVVVVVVAAVAGRRRRRRSALEDAGPPADPVPWEILLLAFASLCAYLLARQMAFTLYLPYRPLQHVLAYLVYVAIPLGLWAALSAWLPRRIAGAAVLVVVVTGSCALWGDGLERGPKNYVNYKYNHKFYKFVRTLPNDAIFGGDFTHTASIPMFGAHQVYVNKNLAHPFRKGYYAEVERRIRLMYEAMYATSFDDVVAFGARENVQYLAYREGFFAQKDKRLFQPLKTELDALWAERRRGEGFALEHPPKEAVVYRHKGQLVVKIAALAGAQRATPAKATPTTPAAEPKANDDDVNDDANDDDDVDVDGSAP